MLHHIVMCLRSGTDLKQDVKKGDCTSTNEFGWNNCCVSGRCAFGEFLFCSKTHYKYFSWINSRIQPQVKYCLLVFPAIFIELKTNYVSETIYNNNNFANRKRKWHIWWIWFCVLFCPPTWKRYFPTSECVRSRKRNGLETHYTWNSTTHGHTVCKSIYQNPITRERDSMNVWKNGIYAIHFMKAVRII